jgi:hypothetical protein
VAEPRFDWYAATLPVLPEVFTDAAMDAFADTGGGFAPSRPINGYSAAQVLEDAEGKRLTCLWGGKNGYAETHVVATGGDADLVARMLRDHWPDHRVARVDACYDFDSPGLYEQFRGLAQQVAEEYRLQVKEIRPLDDPTRGSTCYVGSNASDLMARLYEKGLQLPLENRPEWVRAELQFRPHKTQKSEAASMSAREVWGARPWSALLATLVTGASHPVTLTRARMPVDFDRTHTALLHQYGGHLRQMLWRCGGAWDSVGLKLGKELESGGIQCAA